MSVEANAFCAAECGNRTLLPVGKLMIESGDDLSAPWRMVVVEKRHWAVCSDACEQSLKPERLRELYEERIAHFKIGNSSRRLSDDD